MPLVVCPLACVRDSSIASVRGTKTMALAILALAYVALAAFVYLIDVYSLLVTFTLQQAQPLDLWFLCRNETFVDQNLCAFWIHFSLVLPIFRSSV